MNWPLNSPPNEATLALRRILVGETSILHVCRDADDGMWQFLDGRPVSMDEAMLVGLKEIVAIDSSVGELADMPVGWEAVRDSVDDPWRRRPM